MLPMCKASNVPESEVAARASVGLEERGYRIGLRRPDTLLLADEDKRREGCGNTRQLMRATYRNNNAEPAR